MSSTTSSSNLTSGFIDLSTYDEVEKYIYGGDSAVSYFVRRIRKSTWFTIVPVVLSNIGGSPTFGANPYQASISRAGDYLLNSWLRVDFPQVTTNSSINQFGANGRIRWTRNLMHNLIQEAQITFNDMVAMRFDSFFLDFWAAFTIPAGKRNGYNNMIGNFSELIDPIPTPGAGLVLPATTLNLPLPYFYSRDTGVALPTAALPYNDMKLVFYFRQWQQLLICDNIATGVSVPAVSSDLTTTPVLGRVNVWAEYALVSNDERKRMGQVARDILIEQVQTASLFPVSNLATYSSTAPATFQDPIHFSHAIKVLFFGFQNTTNSAEWSNYTCASPVPTPVSVNLSPSLASDPISTTSLYYENTQRLSNMGSDYFSLVHPFYRAVSIPTDTGYHTYCYTADMVAIDPMGSTNYGKLTNVIFEFQPSANAVIAAQSVGTATNPDPLHPSDGAAVKQNFSVVIVGVDNNIVRVSGGTLGFPVL